MLFNRPYALFPLQIGVRVHFLALFIAALACISLSANVIAQGAKKADVKKEKTAEPSVPEKKEIELISKDRVLLKVDYYPGTLGKESVPVVLIHPYKGDRSDYNELALYLQKQGHAVIAPDLRWHGGSTRIEGANIEISVKNKKFPKGSFEGMISFDMESVKKFLMAENNKQKLNIQKLVSLAQRWVPVSLFDMPHWTGVGANSAG